MTGKTFMISSSIQSNIFQINGKNNSEVLKITHDGEIYIKGKLIETNKDIVRYSKVFMKNNYKQTILNDIRQDPDLFQDVITTLRREKIEKLLKR